MEYYLQTGHDFFLPHLYNAAFRIILSFDAVCLMQMKSFPSVIKNQSNQEAHKNHMDAHKPVSVLPGDREHKARQPCQMCVYNG